MHAINRNCVGSSHSLVFYVILIADWSALGQKLPILKNFCSFSLFHFQLFAEISSRMPDSYL